MTENISDNPIILFQNWLEEAKKLEINDAEAMALATCTADGKPSVRMILLKQADEKGFKFHTSKESQKGIELARNPHAALCFHWKSLRKQVRIEGIIETISKKEADDYFKDRPYERQIGAWASDQSRALKDRDYLEKKINALKNQYPKGSTIPRPEYWVGYRLIPETIEFWWDNTDRLHDRIQYTKNSKGNWGRQRLYP